MIVPFREEMNKRHLKVAGDLGRVVFMVCLLFTYDDFIALKLLGI